MKKPQGIRKPTAQLQTARRLARQTNLLRASGKLSQPVERLPNPARRLV